MACRRLQHPSKLLRIMASTIQEQLRVQPLRAVGLYSARTLRLAFCELCEAGNVIGEWTERLRKKLK